MRNSSMSGFSFRNSKRAMFIIRREKEIGRGDVKTVVCAASDEVEIAGLSPSQVAIRNRLTVSTILFVRSVRMFRSSCLWMARAIIQNGREPLWTVVKWSVNAGYDALANSIFPATA